ncbi:MAG: ROK family protein [Armatimonadia bacterium]|nr:ROK family protein [Armatimonadia bacterium]
MTADDRHFVGVDVGGTKILAVVVTAAGEILARQKTPTAHDGTPIAEQIGSAVEVALDDADLSVDDLAGIGVAMPGSVDSTTGYLGSVPNIDIDDHQFVDSLRKRYPCPVEVGNDVNLGTLAECWLGAGRDAATVVGMFVGTGIGGGVVIDGRLRTGSEDLGGEIGHMVMMVDGPECGCGNLGCFEALASRTAMEKAIRDGLAEGRESVILDYAGEDRIKSGALRDALNDGDELVTEVITRACHVLAQGALTIRHLLDPDMIVMGGGVIEACEQFMIPLIDREVRASCMKGSRDTMQIAVSELGDDAVALGAAALVEAAISDLPVYEMQEGAEQAPTTTETTPADSMLAAAVEDLEAVDYPRIESVEFGSVTVDGETLEHDIHIRANGKLKKRKKKWARKDYGTSHIIGPRELKKALKKGAEALVIGEGFDGMVRLAEEGREMLEQRGVRWEMLPTEEAIDAWEGKDGRKALILHVTC